MTHDTRIALFLTGELVAALRANEPDAPEASEHQRISCVAFPVLVERLGHRMSNESVLECVQRMKDEAIRKES